MSLKAVTFQIFALTTISIAYSYVLVQVRKGENESSVDALIRKAIPAEKFEEIANTARRQLSNYNKYKVKKDGGDNKLESIVFAIKTPAKNEQSNKRDLAQNLVDFIKDYVIDNSMHFRKALQKYNIKPEVVNFKSGKPSLLYQINLQNVVDALRRIFNSEKFKRRSEDAVKKVAEILRRFKDEVAKIQ